METFSALPAICAWTSPVNSPHKDQWRGALMFSLIYAWINDWVNNGKAGDLRRYPAHYDVTVMDNASRTSIEDASTYIFCKQYSYLNCRPPCVFRIQSVKWNNTVKCRLPWSAILVQVSWHQMLLFCMFTILTGCSESDSPGGDFEILCNISCIFAENPCPWKWLNMTN